MKKFFLPTGLLAALFCALLLPKAGILIAGHGGIRLLVAIIFLVSGFQISTSKLQFNRKLLGLFCLAATISLFFGPLLGVALTQTMSFPPALGAGLIIITSMPPTISSGIVITGLARGNTLLALFLTISLNLLAVFTIPLTLSIFLEVAGPVTVERGKLLATMLVLVLLPLAMGRLLRKALKKKTVSENWNYVNSGCVIAVVYASLAMSGNRLGQIQVGEYIHLGLLVTGIHLLLFVFSLGAGNLLKLPADDIKALAFVSSQKTLAMALAVITGIGIDAGKAIIVCLMFHFLQLFADSFLASWWQNKNTAT